MYFDDKVCLACIEQIREVTEIPVAMIDASGRLLGCTHTTQASLARQLFKLCAQSSDPVRTAAAYDAVFSSHYLEGELACYVLMLSSNPPVYLPGYVEAVVGLLLEQQNLQEQAEGDFSERIYFINQLTTLEGQDGEFLASLAAQLKYTPSMPRCAVLFQLQDMRGTGINFGDGRVKQYFQRALEGAVHYSPEDIYGFLNVEQFIVFKAVPDLSFEKNERWVKEFALSVIEEMREREAVLVAGAGSAYGQLRELHSSYAQSQFVLSNFRYLDSEQSVVFVHRHIFEYLTSLLPQEYLEKKFDDFSAVLRENPASLETLIALSKNNTSLAKTAVELGIHRNTMLQRFGKLKELLGINPLHDDRDRAKIRQYTLYRNRKTILHAGIIIQDGSALHAGCSRFAHLIAQKSNDSMALNIHTISLSGNNRHLLEILKSGSIDFALCDINALDMGDGRVPVLNLPFLFDSADEAYAILDGPIGQGVFSALEPDGVLGMHFWSMGWRMLSTRDKRIRCPEDLAGLKIRIMMQKDAQEKYFQMQGAVTVQMNYDDVQAALKQGLVDSQENPYTNFWGMRFYETQHCISEVNMSFDMLALLTTTITWAKMTPHQQEIVRQAAREATLWQREEMQRMNDYSRDKLQKHHGVRVCPMDPADLPRWKHSVEPLYERFQWQEHLREVLQAKEEYRAKGLSAEGV